MLTENYYIVHHSPFLDMNPTNLLKIFTGVVAPGQLLRYNPHLPSRMIVIPRATDSTEPVRFLDTEPCHIYHHCMYTALLSVYIYPILSYPILSYLILSYFTRSDCVSYSPLVAVVVGIVASECMGRRGQDIDVNSMFGRESDDGVCSQDMVE